MNGEFFEFLTKFARVCEPRAMACSTESDSEIALHLYQERGTQATTLLRGEFAIVRTTNANGR